VFGDLYVQHVFDLTGTLNCFGACLLDFQPDDRYATITVLLHILVRRLLLPCQGFMPNNTSCVQP